MTSTILQSDGKTIFMYMRCNGEIILKVRTCVKSMIVYKRLCNKAL